MERPLNPAPEEFTYEHLQSAYAEIETLQQKLHEERENHKALQAEHKKTGEFMMAWAVEDEISKDKEKLDSKTGLLKNTYFRQEVSNIIEPSSRANDKNRRHSLIIADLDDFKLINDLIGYLRADNECLAPVGRMINKNLRKNSDLAGRFGGEEFVIFLADTGVEEAMIVSDKLRDQVNTISWKDQIGSNDAPERLGISMGLTELKQGTPYAQAFDMANIAVARAKQLNGKNQTVIAD